MDEEVRRHENEHERLLADLEELEKKTEVAVQVRGFFLVEHISRADLLPPRLAVEVHFLTNGHIFPPIRPSNCSDPSVLSSGRGSA